jgi:magnesium transporter
LALTYFRWLDGRTERFDHFHTEYFTKAPTGSLHWIDLDAPTEAEAALLRDPFQFHPLAIEDCLLEVNQPKADDYESYLFAIVHGIRFDAPKDKFETRELDIFLGPNYLVTHHEGPMRSVANAQEQCGKNISAALPKGVAFLLHQILDALFEHYFPNLDAIEEQIQRVQSDIFVRPAPATLDRIFTLKADVLQLRRLCMPQREIVLRLSRGEFPVIDAKAALYFRDTYDHLYRIVDASYGFQDMIQSCFDAYLSVTSNRLNETMKRLTVISAMIAPLTVLTGIYGMNFDNLPELHWRYGYFVVLGLVVAIPLGLYFWFRRKGWI